MKNLFFFLLTLGISTVLRGQQSSPNSFPGATAAPNRPAALPPGPLLKPLPDNARCTLTIISSRPKPAASESGSKKSLKSGKFADRDSTVLMVGETMGQSVRLSIVQSNGNREDQWTDGKLLAVSNTGSKSITFSDESIDKIPTPDWVSSENFIEFRKQGNKNYLVFQAQILPAGMEVIRDLEAEAQGQPHRAEGLKVSATALVDAETRLPFSVQEGETTTTYKYEALAPDAQIVPAAILASLAEREQKVQDVVRKPVRP